MGGRASSRVQQVSNGLSRSLTSGIEGSSRILENCSRFSAQSGNGSIVEEPEFLFDNLDSEVNLFVETPQCSYKLLEPEVANLIAKRSKCDVWKSIIALKKGAQHIDTVFQRLDDWGCFAAGSEWRGILGETVFHICFLLMGDVRDGMILPLGKMGIKIHEKNPWFLNAQYSAGVYEGETAMHIAVAHGDLASVKWLLRNGANLECNAIGKFFARFQWGEHPVSWAACSRQTDILEELLESKADLDYRDSQGNSVLHSMALARLLYYSDAFKEVYNLMMRYHPGVANHWNVHNHENRTPLQLAAAKKEGNFGAMMSCHAVVQWTLAGVLCTAHPLARWDSAHSMQFQEGQHVLVGTSQEEVSALEVAVLESNTQFFCVPLNQLLIKSKWALFVRHEFTHRCAYFFLFVALATAAACVHDGFRVATFLRLWTFFLAMFMLAYYSYTSCRVMRTAYFKATTSRMRKVLMIDAHKMFATMLVLLSISMQSSLDLQTPGSEHHRVVTYWLYGWVMPLALIQAWLCVFEMSLLYEYWSKILLVIIDCVQQEIPSWLLLQGLLWICFSSSMYIATAKVYNEQHLAFSVFGNYYETLASLALVPLGGIADVQELLTSDNDIVVCALYCLYSVFSCVLFLNLTISLFTERTRDIWKHAGKYYHFLLALQCIADEKRRRPEDLRRYLIGSQLGDGKHYLITQKFPKHELSEEEGEHEEMSEDTKIAEVLKEVLAERDELCAQDDPCFIQRAVS